MTWPDLDGRRVLVTGATGFLGGRIVERLALETEANIRVAVPNLFRLPRVARFDVEVVQCDLLDPVQVDHAVRGSDIVFHCAYGNRGSSAYQARVTVDGTSNLLEAAQASNAERVVHFSTFAVYGSAPAGILTEASPRRKTGQPYADHKLEAEKRVNGYARDDLPVSILQPTVVYGPFGNAWTSDILERLTTGRAILIDGGQENCNAVYVDDVVTAAFLAATKREAVGETFLISGHEQATWADFYRGFEDMLGRTATVSMSEEEALRYWKRTSRRPGLWGQLPKLVRRPDILRDILKTREGNLALRVSHRVLPKKVRKALLSPAYSPHSAPDSGGEYIHPLNPHRIRFLARSQEVVIDKAASRLGYRPAFSLERGMHLTRLWAEWAGLLRTE